jgi:hypothetical protein
MLTLPRPRGAAEETEGAERSEVGVLINAEFMENKVFGKYLFWVSVPST